MWIWISGDTRPHKDVDKWSRACVRKDEVILDSYSGTYHFNKSTKEVTLDDGVKTGMSSALYWEIQED